MLHFFHYRYDESQIVDDGLIFLVQYASASYPVVTPRGKNFCGKMFIRIACHFDDEGICCVAICFSTLVISKNFFLDNSFVMCCSFTSVILMPSMRWVL